MNDYTTKICPKCGKEYPATTEYFPKQTRNSDGFHSWCKPCNIIRSREWRKHNRDKVLANKKRYREKHPKRVKEAQKKSIAKKPEYYREREKHWYAENIEAVRKRRRRYKQRNREHINAENRNYRANKKSAVGKHTAQDIKLQMKTQLGLCWWCGQSLEEDWHVDHRIPLSKGGSNGARNLVIAHQHCNLSKLDKMPWEYNGRLL